MKRRSFLGMLVGLLGAFGIAVKVKPGQFVVTEVDHETGTITVDSQPRCSSGLAWHVNHGTPYKGMYRDGWPYTRADCWDKLEGKK